MSVDQTADLPSTSNAISRLWSAVDRHLKLQAPLPERTTRLLNAGNRKMAEKLVEEAGEVAIAAASNDRAEVVQESADLLYHLTLLWATAGISPEKIWAEMTLRETMYGLAEKRAKKRPPV